MNQLTLEAALSYAHRGWRVIPLNAATSGRGKIPMLKGWQKEASTDPSVISTWFKRCPDANLGIATGKASNLLVLDVDGSQGQTALAALIQRHGELPATLQVITGGGGKHLYFTYPEGVSITNSAGKLRSGLDVRGEGGQVVAPPSLHHSGQRYAWENAGAHTTLADAPDWLIKLLSSPVADRHHQTVSLPEGEIIPEGRRNSSLARLAGRLRSQGMGLSEISAALLSLNQTRCQPPLEKSEVLAIAKSMARYTPKRIPTDDELADHWLEAHPDTAYGRMTFMRYRDGLWHELPSSQVEHEILAVIEEAKESGYKPSYWKLHSIMELGRVMVTIPDEAWDADAELLVCRNGTLHIPSRSLREHSPQDHITSGLDFDYDPQAQAATWRYFLNDTVPDAQEFLQEFAGYALTTDTRHEIAVWLYGAPGSGKSTFLSGLLAMLGSKAGLLGLADIERSRFALTGLPGKTLMVSSEQPASYITTSHIINSLISGEPLTVERKYKEAFTLLPFTKIVWAMNETPRIAGGADGLFRRVKVVQFPKLKCPPNPALKEIIKGEGAGILNWALDGLEHLKARDHFDIPPCIVNATQEFQKKNDIPAMFVTENCEVHPGNAVKSSLLYERYKQWCFDNGLKAQSIVTLAEDWQRLGFSRVRRRDGCFYWEGVRLIDTFLMKDNEGYK